jgi:hypothetical protein
MLNAVSDRLIVKRMAAHRAMPLQNGFGMGNGFNRRIRVVNGFARPVLAISRAEVDGGLSWIPSSVQSFSGTCHCVCRLVAFESNCKLSRLDEDTFWTRSSRRTILSNPRSGETARRIMTTLANLSQYFLSDYGCTFPFNVGNSPA